MGGVCKMAVVGSSMGLSDWVRVGDLGCMELCRWKWYAPRWTVSGHIGSYLVAIWGARGFVSLAMYEMHAAHTSAAREQQ